MIDCISLRRGTSKLLELVPNPLICSINYIQNKGPFNSRKGDTGFFSLNKHNDTIRYVFIDWNY